LQAASENNVDDLKMLLRNGIDPDIGDYDARTALHLAAAEGSLRVADALIEFGANINVVDRWGATPLQVSLPLGSPTHPVGLHPHTDRAAWAHRPLR
jgi:ankyrin repeat protein